MKASNGTSSRKDQPAGRRGNEDSSSSTAKRFTLSGPSLPLDERIHAYRRDIADIALAGQIIAPHYARPLVRAAGAGASAVLVSPSPDAARVSELRPGDEFAVIDVSGGWAWGYRRLNHHVGYVPVDHLADSDPPGRPG